MCGIAGIVHFDGKKVDPLSLDRVTDAIAHRGPDGRGTYIDQNVGLGHRRLSIIDLSENAAQPMQSADEKYVITYNGEVYNFREERSRLEAKGYTFRSTSDTEVILALYQEYGTRCVEHMRGMFAFAIYDTKKQQLFLARDRVGQKPCKYYFDGNTFLFASELKSLLTHSACDRSIDPEAIHHFLTMMYLPAPLTGFKHIKKLEAGHSLLLDLSSHQLTKERYWSLEYSREDAYSEEEWKEQILTLLRESVQLRQIADVPVGAFLSGGIDSAAVVLHMQQTGDEPIKTFSIGSATNTHNELPDAERIAILKQTDHHPKIVEPDVCNLLPTLVQIYEEPYADPSAIPTYHIAQLASEHRKVVLTGDGGDENFMGYVRYPILRFSRRWEKAKPLHPLVKAGTALFHSLRKSTFSYRCHRFQSTMHLPWHERYLQYLSFFTDAEKRKVYASSFADQFERTDLFFSRITQDSRESARDMLHQAVAMDVQCYLADDLMPKVDMASMHFGLECRAPFLDHHFLELTARIPASRKLHGRSGKHIFKKALRGILPEEHFARKKTGFRLPLDTWFREDKKEFLQERLLSDAPHKWDFFERSEVEKFLHQYHNSSIDYSDHIWALLWLDEWFRQYATGQ